MDASYKPIQQQADQLQHRMRDLIDAGDGSANDLAVTAREVMEDVECNKAPRAVEARINELKQRLLRYTSGPAGAVSPQDARSMHDAYEQLRRQVRSLPHY